MEQILERLLAGQEQMKGLLKAGHEELMAIRKASMEEMKSVEEHQEVPKQVAAVETIGALKAQYGDRHLAIECRQQPKKWTQGDGGCGKNLATPTDK
jgi:hypothetical protein